MLYVVFIGIATLFLGMLISAGGNSSLITHFLVGIGIMATLRGGVFLLTEKLVREKAKDAAFELIQEYKELWEKHTESFVQSIIIPIKKIGDKLDDINPITCYRCGRLFCREC
ncbi:hypothetical protein [Natranaerobius trueperi]|uniref:Uncharacterized protein n=1 Tax=Natranaerobius trueperi TaxID=759412 RepID=A0A226BYF3_9FIRM|nr:hypothetical protein [Natranaerobius trueperi]OWZ84068.1 hypothetical protein CDO51_04955 [Natranaerobius trueperi]